MILYKIKCEWENQRYKLTERLEDVRVSVNFVPNCELCIRLMSGTGSAGRLLLTVAGRLLLTIGALGDIYRGADNSLARPTSRCILIDGDSV